MKLYGGSRKAKRIAGREDINEQSGNGRLARARSAWNSFGKLKKTLIIIPIVLVTLTLIGFAVHEALVRPPDVDGRIIPSRSPVTVYPSVKPGSQDDDPVEDEVITLDYRENVYTVLLAGTFEDGNTDTIMVATLDLDKKSLDVISIPRDTLVDVSRSLKKINAAYSYGGSNNAGMESLCEEISSLLGYAPDRYVMIKMSAFKKIVNAMDGVDFDVPVKMYHYDGETTIDIPKGPQRLNGDKALQVMRYRGYGNNSGVGNNDYGRMRVQQLFLTAIAKQMLSVKNVGKIPEIIGIVSDSIKPTDLKAEEMLWFSEQIIAIGAENINFYTLPTTSINYKGGNGTWASWYELINKEEALALINETVNPYNMDITEDMLSWLTLTN